MLSRIIDWFIPTDKLGSRTDRELASTFVFTHLLGPFTAYPMWGYVCYVSGGLDATVVVLSLATAGFWLLPFVLRHTGRIRLAAMLSFQLLAMTSLFGSYHYGGFNSPLLPWLIASLALALFYQSKDALAVIAVFVVEVLLFVGILAYSNPESRIPIEQLGAFGWLSAGSATVYITWLALHYSRIVGMRSDLEAEAERSRQTFVELEEARAKAEEMVRTRALFFSKVSHELRTPLNAIIGYSEILIEDLEDVGGGPDDRVRDVSRIITAGKHLLSLVSRVLDSKAIEGNEEYLDVNSFKLRDMCDDVVATAQPMVEKNGNRFVTRCLHPDYLLSSDATRLRQVLLNLLSNAAKFTSNGVVKLELDVIEQESGDILRAAVTDTGIGISEAGISRIFRSYEQAEVDTVAKYGGTGIGLPLSQHFCHLLGGEITVNSRSGQGSCFTAWVPAQYRLAGTQRSEEDRAEKHNLNPSRREEDARAHEGLAA